MRLAFKKTTFTDWHGKTFLINVIEVRMGIYSDIAIRLLEWLIHWYQLTIFTYLDILDSTEGFFRRAEDGEIVLIVRKLELSKDCGLNKNSKNIIKCNDCKHYLKCIKQLVKDSLVEAVEKAEVEWTGRRYNDVLERIGASMDEANIFRRLLDAVIDGKEDLILIGAPLDPFRLESIKTLKSSILESGKKNKNLNGAPLREYAKALGLRKTE